MSPGNLPPPQTWTLAALKAGYLSLPGLNCPHVGSPPPLGASALRRTSIPGAGGETFSDPRTLKPLLAVREELGDRAEAEHWVASRTRHTHTPLGIEGVRLIDTARFKGWFADS